MRDMWRAGPHHKAGRYMKRETAEDRHLKIRMPPARLGANEGRQLKTDTQRAGHHEERIEGRHPERHHQPHWETNGLLKGRKINWRHPECRHHKLDRAGQIFKKELRTPTANCFGKYIPL